MFFNIIFWCGIIWLAFEILRRLFVSVVLIVSGYKEKGLWGAFVNGMMVFLLNLWEFLKTVFWIILIVIIISFFGRSCGK